MEEGRFESGGLFFFFSCVVQRGSAGLAGAVGMPRAGPGTTQRGVVCIRGSSGFEVILAPLLPFSFFFFPAFFSFLFVRFACFFSVFSFFSFSAFRWVRLSM